MATQERDSHGTTGEATDAVSAAPARDPVEGTVPGNDVGVGPASSASGARASAASEPASGPGTDDLREKAVPGNASGATDQPAPLAPLVTEKPLLAETAVAASGADGGQPGIPAGYRLGDGWEVMGDELCCLPCPGDADVHEEGGFFRRSDEAGCCRGHAVEMGALVPVPPPGSRPAVASLPTVAFQAMARLMESGTNPNSDIKAADELVTTLNRALERLHREHGIPRQAVADFVQTWATVSDLDDGGRPTPEPRTSIVDELQELDQAFADRERGG